MRVLVTGAAGTVGRHLVPTLEKVHDLRLGDLTWAGADARYVRLDVTRIEDVRRAMEGMDAVVHLAVATGHEGEYEDDAFNQTRFDVNVKGTWNVLEAARQAGVRRVVHTSSLMVVWGYPPPAMVAGDALPRPVGTYALTKTLAEEICGYFARQHGLSIVCLRIAKPIDPGDPIFRHHPIRPQWLSFEDLMRGYLLALEASVEGLEIVTLVGESDRRRWDLARAERVLGYRPSLRWEETDLVLGDERALYPA